ncbi:MAG: biopolymer transporter ExbD [Aquificae bacterium]|nr:biopolymer transporter ExbD [Aquificota bacterium]
MNLRKYLSRGDSSFVIDMTALVDIAFIIILFLGIVATLAPVSSINVELPKASLKAKKIEPIKIVVDREGNIYINRKKMTEKELLNYLKQKKEKTVVVLADRRVIYENVVKVMDIAKKAGVEEINIATRSSR